MAIIQCPACGKRISSVNKVCPHCHTGKGVEEDNGSPASVRRVIRERLYRARMGGYVALSVMVLAVLIWWVPSEGRVTAPAQWLQAVFMVGAAGYVVSRYFIFKARQAMRGLQDE